jgi:hypothetical protein
MILNKKQRKSRVRRRVVVSLSLRLALPFALRLFLCVGGLQRTENLNGANHRLLSAHPPPTTHPHSQSPHPSPLRAQLGLTLRPMPHLYL